MRHHIPWGPGVPTVAAMLVLAAPLQAQPRRAQAPATWVEPCTVAHVAPPSWCGWVTVPENRALPGGRSLRLRVLVVGAREGRLEPDPVFWLNGGPGVGSTASAAEMTQLLWQLRQHRDLVFVDLRGTGESHPLRCDPPHADRSLQAYFSDYLDPELVRRCLVRLNVDVRQFTTPIAMDDLDVVRRQLGYSRINLVGGSYGSRAALVYLRAYPDHVRTVVLKGVVSTDLKVPLPFARAMERGLQSMFDACAGDPECGSAYPGLRASWQAALSRFTDGRPIAVSVQHPQSGDVEEIGLTRSSFLDGVRQILYSIEDARALPALITAAGDGDFTLYARFMLRRALQYPGMATGLFLSVTCSEDVPFITARDIAEETGGTDYGSTRVLRQLAACAEWPAADVGVDYLEPVQADVPVLLLSGELDTATPWEVGERVARTLPKARHVVFPNASHDYANERCQTGLITQFIQAGSADALDLACVGETRRPPFRLSIAP